MRWEPADVPTQALPNVDPCNPPGVIPGVTCDASHKVLLHQACYHQVPTFQPVGVMWANQSVTPRMTPKGWRSETLPLLVYSQ
jgi:hypothetical protein